MRHDLMIGSGNTDNRMNIWSVIRRFVFISVPLSLVLGCVIWQHYRTETRAEKILFKSNEVNVVNVRTRRAIVDEFKLIVSDLMFLANHNELRQILDMFSPEHKQSINSEWRLFTEKRGLYDQIRYLDKKGMEIIRVNYNNGEPTVVSDGDLQFKGERYYFKDALKLGEGDVFVSPLDLNFERGMIETPLKPVIRFGTPVFDSKGNKRGIILLNYLGERIMEKFVAASSSSAGTVFLLNSASFYLKGMKKEDEWGFMYEDRTGVNFESTFPRVWPDIAGSESGQFQTENGLFTFETIHPLLESWESSTGSDSAFTPSAHRLSSNQYSWKIVSYVPAPTLESSFGSRTKEYLIIYSVIITLLLPFYWLLARTGESRKRAKYKIQVQQEELSRANKELERSNEDLQQFAYVASHDLREPLRIVSGYVQLLARRYKGKLDMDADDFIYYTIDGVRRMEKMIDDLLAYSRVGTKGKVLKHVNSKTAFDQAVANLKMAIDESEAVIRYDHLPDVVADEGQMVQLFQNLIGNAIKFHDKERPEIRVEAKTGKGKTVFSVTDNGIGIDSDNKNRIFEAFQRLHSRDEYDGTGIGLAVCRKIVERHGGQIWAESEPEKGTTFYFTLPEEGIDNEQTD
jgi:signal transduction histidine kinase